MAFPTTLDTPADFAFATNDFEAILSNSITVSQTTITVNDASAIQSVGGFLIVIGQEIILCSGRAGNDLQVAPAGRGFDGTTPSSHPAGSTIEMFVVAQNNNQFIGKVQALQSAIGAQTSPASGSVLQRINALESMTQSSLITFSGGDSAVGANSTELVFFGPNSGGNEVSMLGSGTITRLSAALTDPRSSGSLFIEIVKNGVVQNQTGNIAQISGNPGTDGEVNSRSTALALASPVSYVMGDRIGIRYRTVSFSPNSADITAAFVGEEQ